jgi:hypothetical protein
VLQRPLHHTESRVALSVPMHVPAGNPDGGIACALKHWPVTSGHGKPAYYAVISERYGKFRPDRADSAL